MEEKLIGEVLFEGLTQYRYKKMKETLLNGKFELIEVAEQPSSLISLPNGYLVCGTTGSVKLLDEYFKEIKSVSTGGWTFCALNRRDEIYVSVGGKHCIILFDLNLNKLKQFGSFGAGNNQFNYPRGLCCHGDNLYVCDKWNKRIQILNLDLEYSSTIQLDDYPRRVQTSETTIGVSCDGGATLFFDLKTRELKFKHDDYKTYNISYIDSTFYASNYEQKKFYFFDSDGNFIEEMAMNERLSERIKEGPHGSLCRHKEILYLADWESSKILKFIE